MTCPSNPPAPVGYRVWTAAVPTELTQWAMQIRDQINDGWPYGQTWTAQYTDPTTGQVASALFRKDYQYLDLA